MLWIGRRRLHDGRAPRGDGRHGRRHDRAPPHLAPAGHPRQGRRTHLPGEPVCAGAGALLAQEREPTAQQHRGPLHGEVPPEEIQGPHHRGRLRPAAGGPAARSGRARIDGWRPGGRSRHTATGFLARLWQRPGRALGHAGCHLDSGGVQQEHRHLDSHLPESAAVYRLAVHRADRPVADGDGTRRGAGRAAGPRGRTRRGAGPGTR